MTGFMDLQLRGPTVHRVDDLMVSQLICYHYEVVMWLAVGVTIQSHVIGLESTRLVILGGVC